MENICDMRIHPGVGAVAIYARPEKNCRRYAPKSVNSAYSSMPASFRVMFLDLSRATKAGLSTAFM